MCWTTPSGLEKKCFRDMVVDCAYVRLNSVVYGEMLRKAMRALLNAGYVRYEVSVQSQ